MIVYNCTQGTPEWHAARAGVTTASTFRCARRAAGSKPLKSSLDLAFGTAIERISGLPLDDGFETYFTRRGHELEPIALSLYEIETGRIVQRCGFIATDDRMFGASADGLVGEDGGVEVKCWTDPVKLRAVLTGGDISEVRDQCLGGMWVTGRKWWDFVLYCPALKSIGREITIIRIDRDDDAIEEMESDLMAFARIVDNYTAALRGPDEE